MKYIYLVLGAIASGKSTISKRILPDVDKELEYVCSDVYKKNIFDISVTGENSSKVGYRCADELMFYRIEDLCKQGRDFILEFCPTNRNKFETIKYYARRYGYRIISYFVGTDDVEINLFRNREREQAGGDHVPEQKIKVRYDDSFNSILEIMCISLEVYFIDNSNNSPKPVAVLKKKKIFVLEENCYWLKEKVIKKILNQRG